MPTGMTLRTIMGLIMVIIVLSLTWFFISSYLNPKCDLKSGDAYRDFVKEYGDCIKVNTEDVCKCGEFDIQDLASDYKVKVTPFKEDNVDKVSISLFCDNGRFAGSIDFGDEKNPEKIRAYFSGPESFLGVSYDESYEDILSEIEEGSHISDELLKYGFEMEGSKRFPIIKGENRAFLLGQDPKLTFVNYKGKVAFVIKTTPIQESLVDCLRK